MSAPYAVPERHSNASSAAAGDYDPGRLLDVLRQHYQLGSDAELARFLDVTRPQISKLRHGAMEMSGPILLRMHEVTGIQIGTLRSHAGDRRKTFRVAAAWPGPRTAFTPK